MCGYSADIDMLRMNNAFIGGVLTFDVVSSELNYNQPQIFIDVIAVDTRGCTAGDCKKFPAQFELRHAAPMIASKGLTHESQS